MWIDAITLQYLIVTIVNVFAISGVGIAALEFWRKNSSHTARALSVMMLGTCGEITLATLAIYIQAGTWEWMITKVVARVIELGLVVRFIHHLRSDD